MPNIALFSDLHAQVAALEKFKAAAHARHIDHYWFLGDALGRGPDDARDVVNSLRELMLSTPENVAIVGNHDLDAMSELELGGMAGAAIMTNETILVDQLHGGQLICEPVLWEWLKALPVQAVPRAFDGVYLAHGAFIMENLAVTSNHSHPTSQDSVMRQTLQPNAALAQVTEIEHATQRPVHLLALGHTHVAACWYVTRTDHLPIECAIFDGPFEVPPPSQHPLMLNPGSLSDPRSLNHTTTLPTWVELNLTNWDDPVRVTFHTL